MTTHSSILVWKIPQTEEPGRLWLMGSQESDTTEETYTHLCTAYSLKITHSTGFSTKLILLFLSSLGEIHESLREIGSLNKLLAHYTCEMDRKLETIQ